MSYESYKKDVDKVMDDWADKIYNGTKSQASEKKEEAENLIASWKKMFPERIQDIQAAVAMKLAEHFKWER